jgi:hypothetical protein
MQNRLAILLIILLNLAGCASSPVTQPASFDPRSTLDSRFSVGELLYADDFSRGTANWIAELEKGGTVSASNNVLDIDVPGGCTLWLKQEFSGPILIEYDATVIQAGGPNDRASDLNCFWMATDPRSEGNIFSSPRSGRFADYNQLHCYYVGLGGNTNTTTRFRRYIGSPTTRPILPEHDLTATQFLIKPNVKIKIQLIASGQLIQYYRNGEKLFELIDDAPYTHGWFAFRTVQNHMKIENVHVRRLVQIGPESH